MARLSFFFILPVLLLAVIAIGALLAILGNKK